MFNGKGAEMAIIYKKKNNIAYITLNRPEAMNAQNHEMVVETKDAMNDIENDPDVRVGILTGAGTKAFCAGADLKQREKPEGWEPGLPNFPPEISKPIIAAINGYCLAGGFELALQCDIRIASENAQFGTPEVKWNLLDGYGCLRAGKDLPWAMMMEMLLTGEFISAQEAYRCGFVSKVVPLPELMPTAERIARRICENGPIAVRMTKYFAYRAQNIPLSEGLRLYSQLGRILHATEDAIEGPRAFAEKRKPVFKNK